MPYRFNILVILCLDVGELVLLSPDLSRPTTKPKPTNWLVRIPSIEAISLIRSASTGFEKAVSISIKIKE